eukprot:scaffold7339_cov249-Pinguiococcus_pyrenoidosus.AAC.34
MRRTSPAWLHNSCFGARSGAAAWTLPARSRRGGAPPRTSRALRRSGAPETAARPRCAAVLQPRQPLAARTSCATGGIRGPPPPRRRSGGTRGPSATY